MSEENFEKLIDEAKNEYDKIKWIYCPAFGSEEIHFNRHGWNHIIRKGRRFRDFSEQQRRIQLIPKAIEVIKVTDKVFSYRKTKLAQSIGHFWEIKGKIRHNSEATTIHVIIRRMNDGRLHFFSVF